MSDDSSVALLLLGPAGATGLYWALYRYYRNTDKSHAFERETLVQARPVTGSDEKIGENNGTRERRIRRGAGAPAAPPGRAGAGAGRALRATPDGAPAKPRTDTVCHRSRAGGMARIRYARPTRKRPR